MHYRQERHIFYAIVKCSSVALGIKRMLEDRGVNITVRVSTDASAAKGITARRGAGKIRRIEVSQLWVQDKARKSEVIMRKVSTKENIADSLTKHVTQDVLNYHLAATGQQPISGGHELAPESANTN